MIDEKLAHASELAESGNRSAARLLILEILQDESHYAPAWSALIELAANDAERRKAIYQFWALEPENPEANRLLDKLKAGKLSPIDEKAGLSSRNYAPKMLKSSFWQRLRQWIPLVFLLLGLSSHAQETGCFGAPISRLVTGEQARVIAEGGSNLRSLPSAESTLLNVVPQNELIPVIDGPYCSENLAWWQVDYEGERGWLAEGLGEFYWLAPYIVQQMQIGSIRLESLPDIAASLQGERLGDPLRTQFILAGFPVTSPLIIPFIVIFDEASAAQRQSLTNIESRATAAQFLAIETSQFSGMRLVELYYPNAIEESVLIYHFMGLSADNRFIDAYFPLFVENLPLPYNANQNYLEATAELIAAAPEFQPTLESLDLLLQSLQFDAPLEESNLLHYDEGGIRFDYNPVLAYRLEQSFVEEDLAYIRLDFLGYPLEGEASIRIYRSEDMTGAELNSFEQTLSRQPKNPPRLPLEGERPETEIVYLTSGLRYLSETSYHYFGLSNSYYILMELPITENYPPPAILDALASSLSVAN
jgi:hypothetical protein